VIPVLELLIAVGLALSVIFSIWRISGDLRRIREHLDFIAPAMRAAWKHQGIDFGVDPDRSRQLAEANAITRRGVALKRRAGATPDPSAPGSLGLRSIADIKAAAEKGGTHETRLPPLV